MTICIDYRMKAYIECDNVQDGISKWECADLENNSQNVSTEYVGMIDAYDADTYESIKTQML